MHPGPRFLPALGKDHPSRGRRGRAVPFLVPNNSQAEKAGAPGVSGRSSRLARLTKGLAGTVFLPLLLLPTLVFSAPPPATHSVTLMWDSNPVSDAVAGYRVYFGTASGNYSGSVVAAS